MTLSETKKKEMSCYEWMGILIRKKSMCTSPEAGKNVMCSKKKQNEDEQDRSYNEWKETWL